MKHLRFSDAIKERWIVKRDKCFDEHIALNSKKALGKGGLDHIYLISESRGGLWLTSKQIKRKINNIREKVSSVFIEQLGDTEVLLSFPVEDLDSICRAARARKRPHLSDEQIERLKHGTHLFRSKKTLGDLPA